MKTNREIEQELVRVGSVDGEDIYLSRKEFQILGTDGALAKYSVLSPKEVRDALKMLDYLQGPSPSRDFKAKLLGALGCLSKDPVPRTIREIVEQHLELMRSFLTFEGLTVEGLIQQFFPRD